MPTAYQSTKIARNQPAKTSSGYGPVADRVEFDLTAALALNDTIDMVKLPAGHVPVDLILDTDDLDSGVAAIVLHAGLRKADGTNDDPDAFIASSTVAQAGGVARLSAVAGLRIAAADVDRNVYITVATAPGTGATSGKIGVTLISRPA
ncbi:MAG: hypothetical protein AB7E72_16240 [Lysobacterales bacterium]